MEQAFQKAAFSSATDKWNTPTSLINDLATVFNWDLDVCASGPNVCQNYITEQQDSFTHEWQGLCWMNPPYGNPEHPCKPNCKKKKCKKRGHCNYKYIPGVLDWVNKAADTVTNRRDQGHDDTAVVCLLPARTDTIMYQQYADRATQITYIKGRFHFNNDPDPAPFPSMFMVFGSITYAQSLKLAQYGWTHINPKLHPSNFKFHPSKECLPLNF